MGLIISVTDLNGAVTSAGDPANQTTTPGYDNLGRVKNIVLPGDTPAFPTATFDYFDWEFSSSGGTRPVQYRTFRREQAGNSYTRAFLAFYDGLGRTIQTKAVTVGGMQTSAAEYDGLSRVTKQWLPYYYTTSATLWDYVAPPTGNAKTTWTYDGLGRALTETAANGTVTTTSYTSTGIGPTQRVYDANGHQTQREHDSFGRLKLVREFSGNNGTEGAYATYADTTYTYDGRDLLTSATDAAGNVATIAYDGLGRKTSMHDPDMGNWSYTYNPDGTLATQTDAKSQVTSFAYDSLGRVLSRTTPADGRVLGYSYDATAGGNKGKGRATGTSVTASGVSQRTTATVYDTRGRATSLATWTSTLGATRTFGFAYDSADRQTSLTYPTGEVVTNGYDAGWRQTSACSSLGGCYVNNATYNALDEPLGWTYGNGLAQGYGYDTLGRATSIQVGGGSVLNLGYTYDNVGNVATIVDTVNSQTQNFAYDHRDRLTHAWTTGSATAAYDETYQYNPIGNITAKGPTGNLSTYSYPASGGSSVRPHAVTTVGANAYSYDTNGNMTARAGKAITWNADNTVASVVGADNVPEGYTYDASGQRATRSRNIGQAGGFTTVYCGGLYEEDVPSGDKRLLYVFNGRVVAQRTIPAGGGGGTLAYLHADHLGSTGATTSSAGATTATQRYAPFGAVRAGGGLPTAIGFTGQRQDGTGLAYYNARYYDSTLARFVSADVAPTDKGNPQTRNRYSYVLNNPLKYSDPTGHCFANPQNEREEAENRECDKYISWLSGWNITVDRATYHLWESWQLKVTWRGIQRMNLALGWDPGGIVFRLNIGRFTIARINAEADPRCVGNRQFACAGQRLINFTNLAFDVGEARWAFHQRLIIHEVAHIWDQGSNGALTAGLLVATGGRVGPAEAGCQLPFGDPQQCYHIGDAAGRPQAADDEWPNPPGEDFADSVAFLAMDGTAAQGRVAFVDSRRWRYVQCVGGGGVGVACGVAVANQFQPPGGPAR